MSRSVEDRLSAAFEAKAALISEERVGRGQPPEPTDLPASALRTRTGRSTHRAVRWTTPLLAAAAVIALLLGTVAVTQSLGSRRPAPAASVTNPGPTATSPVASESPSSTPTPSGTVPDYPPPSPTPEVVRAQPGSADGLPRTITIGTAPAELRLHVPDTWHESATRVPTCCAAPAKTCLLASGDYQSDLGACLLVVFANTTPFELDDAARAFTCGRDGRTTAWDDTSVQGIPASHRVVTNDQCTVESWTLAARPYFRFAHVVRDDSSAALIKQILGAMTLPKLTYGVSFDTGYLRDVIYRDQYYAVIDRVVIGANKKVIDTDRATYEYPFDLVDYSLCSLDGFMCNAADFKAQFKPGTLVDWSAASGLRKPLALE